MAEFDAIVVGSGFSGSVIARRLAEEQNKKILVIERRRNIGGNMFDELNADGIRIQKYGPHIFHTNSDAIYQFVCRFANMRDYKFHCSVEIDGQMMPSPFNFKAIDILYPTEKACALKAELLKEFNGIETATIVELLKSKTNIIKEFGELLFEKDYRLYTAKQWGLQPNQIDISILNRVPILLSYNDNFFRDKYECLPADGFTALFENMLNHKNIITMINTEFNDLITLNFNSRETIFQGTPVKIPIVFTGAIDELLADCFGKLPYRALWFDYRTISQEKYLLDTPIAVYPQAAGYTRITEYKHLQGQKAVVGKTTIAIEYPMEHERASEKAHEPYYPIINDINLALHNKYVEKLSKIENVYLCGRLADYKYYNMDSAIERAFSVYQDICEKF